jgi:DNA-binding XRE family transcriptional regulator
VAAKNVRRITNSRKLNAAEAAEARRLRALAAQDRDEILAEGRRHLAAQRRDEPGREGRATLGQKLRAAREALGLTQAELANRVRVAQAYLSYLEQDQREPSLSIAAKLARELKVPLEELANAAALET